MNVTIKDVAKKAGVSVATVSKALNEKIHVSKKTKDKVNRIAQELGYYPSAFGRGLVLQRTGNIGFILDRRPVHLFSNPFYSRVLDGIEDELVKQDFNLLISAHTFSENNSDSYPKFVREKNVDGLILTGKLDTSLILEIHKRNIPLVLIDNYIKEKQFDCVVTDNEHGSTQAVHYLIEQGHRRIGFLKGLGKHISVLERWNGYKRILKENNIPIVEEWIAEGDVTPEGGKSAILQILSKAQTLPTAFFSTNDAMAIGAMRTLREHGIQIPEQVSIVGFDNEETTAHMDPPLTTVSVEKEEMGKVGTQLLIARIQNPKKPCQRVMLPTRLVIRKSVKQIS